MNDWLNYEGSGSSLSHGFDLGYGYDYGTTRHGSVLVHAAPQAQGPRQPVPGGLGLMKPVKAAPGPTIGQQAIEKKKWYDRGVNDVVNAIKAAGNMFRNGNMQQVLDYFKRLRADIHDIQFGHRYKGITTSQTMTIPQYCIPSYIEGIRSKEDMIQTTEDRAKENMNKSLNRLRGNMKI